jgi:hypothetical protein
MSRGPAQNVGRRLRAARRRRRQRDGRRFPVEPHAHHRPVRTIGSSPPNTAPTNAARPPSGACQQGDASHDITDKDQAKLRESIPDPLIECPNCHEKSPKSASRIKWLEDRVAELELRIHELKEENEDLLTENIDNEYYVQRGPMYDEGPEGLEGAHDKIRELKDRLGKASSAAAEARYTVPPKEPQGTVLDGRAGSVSPAKLAGWLPIGRKKWRDAARAQLAEAFDKLGFVRSPDADEVQAW